MFPIATETAPGSPGPFDRNTPSKLPPAISDAGVFAGKTVTSQACSPSRRKMLNLIPKSYAATRKRDSTPEGPTMSAARYGSGVVTGSTRLSPFMSGD